MKEERDEHFLELDLPWFKFQVILYAIVTSPNCVLELSRLIMDHERVSLWSEDFVSKVYLPIDAIHAYLPSMATHLEATASSNLIILLDGVSGGLLRKIDQYLCHCFSRTNATDVAATDADENAEARKTWIKEFVKNLDAEMLEMMRAEVAKRNSPALEMVLLHNALQKEVNTYSGDVKNVESINAAIEAAVSDSGVIEVLILSHGVSCVLTFEDGTIENYDHVIDTNLKGNIHTIKAALPHIKASEGAPASISIFSSQAGQVGVYGYAVYSATKFALRGLAECLQQELVDRNIRLSLVYPPDTMTPGYLEDLKTIPDISKILSGTSAAMDAVSVARASLAGLEAGSLALICLYLLSGTCRV